MPRFLFPLKIQLGAVFLAFVLALQSPAQADQHMVLPTDTSPLVAVTKSGEKRFSIEIADDEEEHRRGLMFRTEMMDSHGMLFVLERTREVRFWMENTPMPLDLVFIGENGRVRAILPGEPLSRARISPEVPVRFVLELKRGIAQKTGIEPGDRLRHPAIDAVAGPN